MAEVKANQNNGAGANEAEAAQPMTPIEKNNRIFAVLYLIAQVCGIVLFAIFVRPAAYTMVLDNGLF